MPIVIKQAYDAIIESDSIFRIDNKQCDLIRICGYVCEIISQSAFNYYKIDDGTGSILIKWSYEGSPLGPTIKDSIREGVYVRVMGYLRSQKNSIHVLSADIRPITDSNQYTHHFLEVIAVHLYNTKGLPNSSDTSTSIKSNMMDNGTSSMAMPPPVQQIPISNNNNNSMTNLQKRVTDIYRELGNDEGIHQDVVISNLTNEGFSEKDIRDTITFLTDEGFLYNTGDDFHQKLIE